MRARAEDGRGAAVLAAALLSAGASAAVYALHDAPWAFGWHNEHWFQHWAGIAAIVCCLHVILAVINNVPAQRAAPMAWASIPLAASVAMSALPEGLALLTALALLVVYVVWLLRSSRKRPGRRGIWTQQAR